MSPGPDFAIVTRNAMISGRRAGMARVRRALDAVMGTLLVGLGIRLATN